jgi:putative membrane protein
MVKEKKETIDSKYIQQHLANERTFLAWVRTAIAIIGVGFLFSNLHFTFGTSLAEISDLIAVFIGVFSGIIGVGIIVLATISYLIKRRAINDQTFTASKPLVIVLAAISIVIIVIYILYNFI